MERITKQQIQDYVSDVGEFEKEHRKYSSFYASATHTFNQEDVDQLAKYDIDASELLGVTVTLNGYWSDSDGCDWNDMSFNKYEEYQVLVPEVVVPEHYITKYREIPFTVSFD